MRQPQVIVPNCAQTRTAYSNPAIARTGTLSLVMAYESRTQPASQILDNEANQAAAQSLGAKVAVRAGANAGTGAGSGSGADTDTCGGANTCVGSGSGSDAGGGADTDTDTCGGANTCANPATDVCGSDPDNFSSILVQTSHDFGQTWNDPIVVQTLGESDQQDCVYPSLVVDNVTGRIFLFMSFGLVEASISDADQSDLPQLRMAVAFSDDDGQTWHPREITAQVDGPNNWSTRRVIPGHGLQLTQGMWTGRLVQPVVICDSQGDCRFVAVCSDDNGNNWWSGHPVGYNAVDCALVELSDGRLLMKSRLGDQENRCISVYSEDGGRTWGQENACFAYAPKGCTAMLERAFPHALPHTDQARVMFHPRLVYNQDEALDHSEVMVSLDDLDSWAGSARFSSTELDQPDIVPLPEVDKAIVVFGTKDGVALVDIPYHDLGLK